MAKGPQAEYANLVGYFKHLVWLTFGALLIVITAGGIVFVSNMRDLRADLTEKATRLATDATNNAVKAAFEEKNINDQIQKAAQEKISRITDKMIEQQITPKLEPLQKRILMIGQITESQARMRLGFRSGLDDLNAVISKSNDPDTLQFAKSTLTSTAEDFEETWVANHKGSGQSPFAYLQAYTNRPVLGWQSPQNLGGVVQYINTSKDLNLVAIAFLAFRELTGENVKMFDLDAVKKWCTSHEPRCK
jgi:hypothetical protein